MSHCVTYECKSSGVVRERVQSGSLVVGLLALLLISCDKQRDSVAANASEAYVVGASNVPVSTASVGRDLDLARSKSHVRQEQGSAPLRPELEPIPPYVLSLGRDHATLCWVTRDVCVGEVKLSGYADDAVYVEDRPASNYHRVKITGLQSATTYRYEVGRNYVGSFKTADGSPAFEVAVFGHPGGTERAFEYATETLAGRLVSLSPEIALCTGDITFRATIRNMRDCFLHRFASYLSSKPIYISPANHEGRNNGQDYTDFRTLFPYEFGPTKGGSYWFDYKQARFFALTYKLKSKALFREHVKWLAEAIDQSDQEFNIVFLGGQDESYYDKDFLFRTLSKRPVDLVLGGDGGGVMQEKLHGLDFYFSGDGGMSSYPFYYLRFFDHHFHVHGLFSDARSKHVNYRSFYSKKPRTVLEQLKPKQVASDPWALRYQGLDLDSMDVGGVQLDIDWPHDEEVELQLYWKASTRSRIKEQCHLIKPKSKSHVLIHIPPRHPVGTPGEVYKLVQVEIGLAEHRPYRKKYELKDLITNVSIFAR